MNLVEVHILQPVPPANLNRDDTGSPKDAMFGGARRARISSQAQKRAVRDAFSDLIPKTSLAVRTRRLVDELVKRFPDQPENEAREVVRATLEGMGFAPKEKGDRTEYPFFRQGVGERAPLRDKEKDDRTEYLLFLGAQEIDRLADTIKEHWDTLRSIDAPARTSGSERKKAARGLVPDGVRHALEGVLDGGKAVDLALFGRMLADRPEQTCNAACQVAHAISTHRVDREFDFYTAVDDLNPREEIGAGMMGDVEYYSATFYRYANVNLDLLRENLQDDVDLAVQATDAFLRGFILTLPRGKQNSFAAHSLPKFVGLLVREAVSPRNLAAAFERPVFARDGTSLTGVSVEALVKYWQQLDDTYGKPKREWVSIVNLSDGGLPYHNGDVTNSMETALGTVMDGVKKLLRVQ